MNVALHGMEEAAGVRYITTGSNAGTARPGSPVLIRYADDALALCHSREQAAAGPGAAGRVAGSPGAWPSTRTRPASSTSMTGLDFLGFNVRRYRGKLLIKPSKAAVKRIRARLTAEMKALRGHNAQMVLIRLNPVIRGWSAYYRHCVSAKVFDAAGRPHVEADLQVGELDPPSQGETLDRPQVLRQVSSPPGRTGGRPATYSTRSSSRSGTWAPAAPSTKTRAATTSPA